MWLGMAVHSAGVEVLALWRGDGDRGRGDRGAVGFDEKDCGAFREKKRGRVGSGLLGESLVAGCCHG